MTTPNLPNTEDVHQTYVAQNEWAKALRSICIGIEAIAAALAAWSIVAPDAELASWRPLVALCLALVAALLSDIGERQHLLAQECRRVSLRALIDEEEVSHVITVRLRGRVPSVAYRLVSLLPTKSIWEYYGPVSDLQPAGIARMRQLYSYSAFFTWRQAENATLVARVMATVVLVSSFAIIYSFAIMPAGANSVPTLDILCSAILAFVFLRLFIVSRKASDTSRRCESVADGLLEADPKNAEIIESYADEYDYERVSGFQPITFLYNRMRVALDKEWEKRKRALNPSEPPAKPMNEG